MRLAEGLVIQNLSICLLECTRVALVILFLTLFLALDLIVVLAKFCLLGNLFLLFAPVKVVFVKIRLKDHCCCQLVSLSFFFFMAENSVREVNWYLFSFLLSFSNDLRGLSFFKLLISFRNVKLIKRKIHINHQLANHIYKEMLKDTDNYQGCHFVSMFWDHVF